jgi:sucrose-6-phosphate hydrolase SacC (GH32 family)
MHLLCDSKYIILPVGHHAEKRCLKFYEGSQLVYDLQVELDFENPDVEFYLNIERFAGKELELTAEPHMVLDIKKSDKKYPTINNYIGQYRPGIHYSSQRGWINDPNGLVYYRGIYHMFYQYNPVGCKWGNMHWGHAVSRDLIHWEEKDPVLYPDEMGTMFSGSAIVDLNNVTGLKQNDNDVILLFYTAAGDTDSELSRNQPFVQCMAYSIDGGNTFDKYCANPVIPFMEQGNRDPKVLYDAVSSTFIMVLYLAEDRYMQFTSVNLLDWVPRHEIILKGDAECPDFYPLPVDGDQNNVKWVFSGASDRYRIGSFDGSRFLPETEAKMLQYSKDSYAAQTWSDIPEVDGRRVRIAWNRYDIPSMSFNMAMNFPCDMSLRSFRDETFLCAYPVKEIVDLYGESIKEHNIRVTGTKSYSRQLSNKLYDITLMLSGISCGNFHISLFDLVIQCDLTNNKLVCLNNVAPLEYLDTDLELRFLVDVSNIEIFINYGKAIMAIGHIHNYSSDRLMIETSDTEILIKQIKITELKSIWNR